MADVMPSSDNDRAQLILVTALVIAVLFVALALIVNSAIYTENIATRDTGAETSTALQSHSVAVADLQTKLDRTNARLDDGDDYDTSHSKFRSGVEHWREERSENQARSGRVLDSGVTSVNGSQIRQTADGSFESANGDNSWILAQNVEEAGRFEMAVDAGSVYNAQTGDNLTVMRDESFYMAIGGEEVFIYDDPNGNFTIVRPDGEEESSELSNAGCNFDVTGTVDIDIYDATVNGQPCDQLDFYENDIVGTVHDIEYRNAVVDTEERINGTYELIVDTTSLTASKYSEADDEPSERTVLYRIEAELVYQSSETTLETTSESIRWSVLP